jgi:hypothetical protein
VPLVLHDGRRPSCVVRRSIYASHQPAEKMNPRVNPATRLSSVNPRSHDWAASGPRPLRGPRPRPSDAQGPQTRVQIGVRVVAPVAAYLLSYLLSHHYYVRACVRTCEHRSAPAAGRHCGVAMRRAAVVPFRRSLSVCISLSWVVCDSCARPDDDALYYTFCYSGCEGLTSA